MQQQIQQEQEQQELQIQQQQQQNQQQQQQPNSRIKVNLDGSASIVSYPQKLKKRVVEVRMARPKSVPADMMMRSPMGSTSPSMVDSNSNSNNRQRNGALRPRTAMSSSPAPSQLFSSSSSSISPSKSRRIPMRLGVNKATHLGIFDVAHRDVGGAISEALRSRGDNPGPLEYHVAEPDPLHKSWKFSKSKDRFLDTIVKRADRAPGPAAYEIPGYFDRFVVDPRILHQEQQRLQQQSLVAASIRNAAKFLATNSSSNNNSNNNNNSSSSTTIVQPRKDSIDNGNTNGKISRPLSAMSSFSTKKTKAVAAAKKPSTPTSNNNNSHNNKPHHHSSSHSHKDHGGCIVVTQMWSAPPPAAIHHQYEGQQQQHHDDDDDEDVDKIWESIMQKNMSQSSHYDPRFRNALPKLRSVDEDGQQQPYHHPTPSPMLVIPGPARTKTLMVTCTGIPTFF